LFAFFAFFMPEIQNKGLLLAAEECLDGKLFLKAELCCFLA
jgi:hypothetical protein